MPLAPYAKALVSINGGAYREGGQLVPSASTLQLAPESTVSITHWLWEIVDYPPGFAAPAGWTLDTESGAIFYNAGPTPPPILLPSALAGWGKWLFRLTANQGKPTSNPWLCDETLECSMLSLRGLRSIAFGETTQMGGPRAYIGEFHETLRTIDTLLAAGAGGAVVVPLVLIGATDTKQLIIRHVTGQSAPPFEAQLSNASPLFSITAQGEAFGGRSGPALPWRLGRYNGGAGAVALYVGAAASAPDLGSYSLYVEPTTVLVNALAGGAVAVRIANGADRLNVDARRAKVRGNQPGAALEVLNEHAAGYAGLELQNAAGIAQAAIGYSNTNPHIRFNFLGIDARFLQAGVVKLELKAAGPVAVSDAFSIAGAADAVQLRVKGAGTQTNKVTQIVDAADVELLSQSGDGETVDWCGGKAAFVRTMSKSASTVNATTVDLCTFALPNNALVRVDVLAHAKSADHALGRSWSGFFKCRVAAGAVVVHRAFTLGDVDGDAGANAWSLTLDNVGTTVRVRGTGGALPIDWHVVLQIAVRQ